MQTLHKRPDPLSQSCDQSQSYDSLHLINIVPESLHSLLW